jgi:hypothetical protein
MTLKLYDFQWRVVYDYFLAGIFDTHTISSPLLPNALKLISESCYDNGPDYWLWLASTRNKNAQHMVDWVGSE